MPPTPSSAVGDVAISSREEALVANGNDGRLRVLIVGPRDKPNVVQAIEQLHGPIAAHATLVGIDLDFQFDYASAPLDLVIVVGGDGSILQAARQMGALQVPVLGVNCGRLGFLAAISPDDFLKAWPTISHGGTNSHGGTKVVSHLMLQSAIERAGHATLQQMALNEVCILGGPPYKMLEIELTVDSQWATSYRCDGLILSTPIGSTAYNLSAGGPILQRGIEAIVIAPLNPHTLTFRPVVDLADRVYQLNVVNPNESTSVVIDGRVLGTLQPGDRVTVCSASTRFRMLQLPGQNNYRTLRDKLGWGGAVQLRH
jgi:NAD+ kinase